MRAIDLDEAIDRFIQAGQNMSKDQVIYMLNRIPTTEIVRCKDCKYWHSNTEFCDQFSHKSAGIAQRMPPDDFCSYGERSEK